MSGMPSSNTTSDEESNKNIIYWILYHHQQHPSNQTISQAHLWKVWPLLPWMVLPRSVSNICFQIVKVMIDQYFVKVTVEISVFLVSEEKTCKVVIPEAYWYVTHDLWAQLAKKQPTSMPFEPHQRGEGIDHLLPSMHASNASPLRVPLLPPSPSHTLPSEPHLPNEDKYSICWQQVLTQGNKYEPYAIWTTIDLIVCQKVIKMLKLRARYIRNSEPIFFNINGQTFWETKV